MDDDRSCSKLPGHMKPFKPPPTEAELDVTWSKTCDADYKFEFTFPKSTSRRRALELMHWAMVREQKSVFVEASADKVQTMEVAS